ncbi:response regulator [Candidatus Poribacteria bacterium]|nr:response regulator [Candidatus Poribacteria bacterium]
MYFRCFCPGGKGMKKRVLFVEDEQFFLDQLQVALEDEYEIVPAYTAAAGMEIVSKEEFDAVLLDIMMAPPDDIDPEVVNYGRSTGVEICRRIKSIKPEIPIIGLTVVRDPDILEEIKNAGAYKIINKPATSGDVKSALDEIFD